MYADTEEIMKINRKTVLCILAAAVSLALLGGCGSEQHKENEKSLRQIGLNQLERGDYESAVNAFNKALNEHRGAITNLEEDINFYKAYALAEAGKTDEAIDTYTALIEYDKKNADAYYLRGCAYISTGDTKAAVEDFKLAAAYRSDSGELYAGIFEQLMSAGLADEAAAYMEQGLKIKGDSGRSCLARGRLQLAGGDYEQAETELKKALEEEETEAALYLGRAEAALGKSEEAANYYEAYAKENPDDPQVLCALGQLKFEEGMYDQALLYFEQGLACSDIMNKQELWSGKIAAMEYTGDFKGAKKEMKAYLKSYPDDEKAQREYIFLKTR